MLRLLLFAVSYLASDCAGADLGALRFPSAQSINIWKLRAKTAQADDDNGLHARAASFPVSTFTQPLDHFHNTTDATFEQRYWVSTRHYTPGTDAPVIVLDGGETSGTGRLSYMDTGIVDILAKATGGVGVVLEHRYYGKSVGVQNFTTDNLRWLNNEQALEDSANFMRNVKFSGIDEDLTAPNTPWIYYGGSYAGARSAHMKVLYPDLVFGAIASSGVTHAALSNWEYMDVIRTYADPICSANLVRSIEVVDEALRSPNLHDSIKALFNLSGLASDQDFVSILQSPIGAWQDKNWDPAVGDTAFDDFCAALNGNMTDLADVEQDVRLPDGLTVNAALPNYAQYIIDVTSNAWNYVASCTATLEECFGTSDDSRYQVYDISQTWRLWMFQVCTQWGYFTTGPPSPKTPAIISRLLDLDYLHKVCVQAYPPGQFFSIPPLPNVTPVNVLGNFAIAADRLAIIDGEQDPWRPDTPHSQYYAKPRADTVTRPFKLIPGAVHHWDENGLANSSAEPPEIQAIHQQEVAFVQAWLQDFKKPGANATSRV
ncbi:peptidase S28 [Auriscalpium vulgare]|uniref:Peptidase S28 n=1 Tax=Auriscalpium vulgare TaxID=40419 RepID=A0ACB8RBV0_9AGAM|nr:peptidase S28 [Auriscalpium vulgare]